MRINVSVCVNQPTKEQLEKFKKALSVHLDTLKQNKSNHRYRC